MRVFSGALLMQRQTIKKILIAERKAVVFFLIPHSLHMDLPSSFFRINQSFLGLLIGCFAAATISDKHS
jgi:hypothetical protein